MPEDLSLLSPEALKARLADLTLQANALYTERTALEQEAVRRKVAERGTILDKMLVHDRFGAHVRIDVWLEIRIPDSDWIESDGEAQDLAHTVHQDFHGATFDDLVIEFRGHKLRARNMGDRIQVQPMDYADLEQWASLLAASKHLQVHDYHLAPAAVVPLVRELHRTPYKASGA